MNKATFYKEIASLGIQVDALMTQKFEIYKEHIQKINKVLNLTAITDDEGIYLKHFYDSLLIHKDIEPNNSLCDVGSGAGFPGLVLAIARPDIDVTLIEPTTKRTNFLEEVVSLCELDNVTVINGRAEDVVVDLRESFDVVTARAVAYLDILSELCMPFVKIGGQFIAMKGSKGKEEVEISSKAIQTLGGKVESMNEIEDEKMGLRINVKIRKISKTHIKYPRNYGRIKKTPLSGRKND